MPKCPHCNNEIHHVEYRCETTEYQTEHGLYNTEDGWEQEDHNINDIQSDNFTYSCLYCHEDLGDSDDVDKLLKEPTKESKELKKSLDKQTKDLNKKCLNKKELKQTMKKLDKELDGILDPDNLNLDTDEL